MKPEDPPAPNAFDERRTLDELERLHAQVLEAAAARRRAEANFDAFVAGFRNERTEEKGQIPPAVPAPRARPYEGRYSKTAAAVGLPLAAPDIPAAIGLAPSRAVFARRRNAWTAGVIVTGVVLGATVFTLRARRSTATSPEVRPAPVATAPGPPTSSPPVPQPRTVPAPSRGVNLELTTRRRAWVRVTIDGRRAFERVLAAGEHIPLHADSSIVIRAGDAGAVVLTRDGRDAGPLGRDGMIATRAFTVETPAR